MPLHPKIAELVNTLPPADSTPPDPAAKREADYAFLPPAEAKAQLPHVQNLAIPSLDGTSAVPLRVYQPSASGEPGGVIAYLHGGAFFSGDLQTHDHVCRSLASVTGWIVLAVDYRLAPEAAYPAGLDDCRAAIRWAGQNPQELNWDGQRLAVAGDSSGANFAAVLAGESAELGTTITHQILYYPSVDLDFETGSYSSRQELAAGYGLETVGLKPFNSFYLESGADPQDPQVSPIKRESLAGLPKALVITAEYDPLRDEGELYARKLAAAGVEVELIRWEGANHGFVQNFSWLPEMHQAFDATAQFLG